MVYLLSTTQLIFSNAELRGKYVDMLMAVVNDAQVIENEEKEQEILDDLKTEHEAKELLKDDTQG